MNSAARERVTAPGSVVNLGEEVNMGIIKQCLTCGKDFRPTRRLTQKYCGMACAYPVPHVVKPCRVCGKEFRLPPGRAAGRSCCSKQCGNRVPRIATTLEERFWAKVDKNGSIPAHRPDLGPCWIWTASRHPLGYGNFADGSTSRTAHRYSLSLSLGRSLKPGMGALHHCDNPPCVNPAHLFEGTQMDNNLDRTAKGRTVASNGAGDLAHRRKLTSDQVRAIRKLRGIEKQADIAARYGVSESAISMIMSGHNWSTVE